MSVSFRDYSIISDAFLEVQLDEGKIWDAIKQKLGGKLGHKPTDDEIEKELERLKKLDKKDLEKIKKSTAVRDFHARKLAASKAKPTQSTRATIAPDSLARLNTSRAVSRSGQERASERMWMGEMQIDDVKKVGFYVTDASGQVLEGPFQDKSDIPADYANGDGGKFNIVEITPEDLNEAQDFLVTYKLKTGDVAKKWRVTARDAMQAKRKFGDSHYGAKLVSVEPVKV